MIQLLWNIVYELIHKEKWLIHQLRKLIWKRWKKVRKRYKMFRKYDISHDDAIKLANSRKGYCSILRSEILHQTITKKAPKVGTKEYARTL